jgi:hypothetical protein
MNAGELFTVNTFVVRQFALNEYVIVPVPAATPDTAPVEASTVRVPGTEADQVPPVTALLIVAAWPVQTDDAPVNAPGVSYIVTAIVLLQPFAVV